MEMLKLLIADATEEFAQALEEQVSGTYIIKTAHEGKLALEMIRSFKPDVLVLDMLMPGLDGITILQRTAEMGINPVVLATTRLATEYVLESVGRLGVGYVMVKPCEIHATVARLADLVAHMDKPQITRADPRTVVSNLLLNLGMRTKLDGYGYAREAILLAMEQPGQMVTKELYPTVAKMFNSNKDKVERTIRSAVVSALKRGDMQVWRTYFPPGPDGIVSKPTNAEFISRIADRLRQNPED